MLEKWALTVPMLEALEGYQIEFVISIACIYPQEECRLGMEIYETGGCLAVNGTLNYRFLIYSTVT